MESDLSTGDFWIVSDSHFGHIRLHKELCPNRMKYCVSKGYRNFDEYQIYVWNERISDNDIVLNLGDFFINKMNPKKTIENVETIIPRLNFKKMYLIKGNHDFWWKSLSKIYQYVKKAGY